MFGSGARSARDSIRLEGIQTPPPHRVPSQAALVTLLDFKQRVQTYARSGRPFS
jgi:hypothetical protein